MLQKPQLNASRYWPVGLKRLHYQPIYNLLYKIKYCKVQVKPSPLPRCGPICLPSQKGNLPLAEWYEISAVREDQVLKISRLNQFVDNSRMPHHTLPRVLLDAEDFYR